MFRNDNENDQVKYNDNDNDDRKTTTNDIETNDEATSQNPCATHSRDLTGVKGTIL